MKVWIGTLAVDITEAQADSLRQQLGVTRTSEGEWISLKAAASRLGVSPDYLYDHAKEHGGTKFTDSPKARWHFPAARLEPAQPAKPESPARAQRRKRSTSTPAGVKLLAIKGERPYAAPQHKAAPGGGGTPAEGLTTGGTSSHG